MGGKNVLNAHAAFGDTNRADSVPDRLAPDDGPVYLEGRLVLSLSFQGGPVDVSTEGAGDLIERLRIWDDLAEAWRGDGLEVLRFEMKDVVVRLGAKPAVLWQGAVDTHARVIAVPDLDPEGIRANLECDLCWRRV